ncbi:MAG: LptF/LptG family permease [Pseudomonadota bacterium]
MPAQTLLLYLNSSIGRAILLPLAGLAMLALAIELREKATLLLAQGGVEALLLYALYAVPEILVTVAPIALLAGAILGFALLERRSEAVILRASGLSALQIAAALLPLGLILGAGLHVLDDRLVPLSEDRRSAAFGTAGAGDEEDRMIWLRMPGWVLRAQPLDQQGRELGKVTLFALGPEGALERRIDARHASYGDDGWALKNATVTSAETGEGTSVKALDWSFALSPKDVRALENSDRALSRASAQAVLAGERLATEPRSFYEMRAARAISLAAMPIVLILLAVPVVLGSARSDAALIQATAISAALGLAFVMGEGIATSLGEKGLVAPMVAAWVPVLSALLLGLWAVLWTEGEG